MLNNSFEVILKKIAGMPLYVFMICESYILYHSCRPQPLAFAVEDTITFVPNKS